MRTVKREISKEEYIRAQEGSPYDLISDNLKMGYGVYCAKVYEIDGNYYLTFDMGDSCD